MWIKFLLFLLTCVILCVSSKKSNIVRGRSGMVHLFEWTYRDIASECVFLSEMGYGAVVVSPVQESTNTGFHTWWDRFEPLSFKIATRSGNGEDLKKMVKWCNDLGIRVYVEIIINHMGYGAGKLVGYAGSEATPDNSDYPAVPFTEKDFHEKCVIYPNDKKNMSDSKSIRNCRWFGPDLDYRSENVRERVKEFLNKLISFGVAGFRVQGCKFMWPEELTNLFDELDSLLPKFGFKSGTRPDMICEIKDPGDEPVSKYEYVGFSKITEHKYAEDISDAFSGRKALAQLYKNEKSSNLVPSADAVVFLDNFQDQHLDQATNTISFQTPKTYKVANAFMLAFPYGEPSILSSYYFSNMYAGPPSDEKFNILEPIFDEFGQCTNGYVCEHRWPEVVAMLQFHNVVQGSRVWSRADNGQNQIAFCRGELGFIAINSEITINMKVKLRVCVPPGIYCDVITGGKLNGKCVGKKIEVDENSKAMIFIPHDSEVPVVAFHIESKL